MIGIALLSIISLVGMSDTCSFSLFQLNNEDIKPEYPTEYGVDVSFPIHHYINSKRYPQYAKAYQRFMEGCYKDASKYECDATEHARLEMNRDQPSKQHNYTEIGFKKITLPKEAWGPLLQFYKANLQKEKPERWPKGSTYVNHWETTPSMISFEDSSLRGGLQLKELIWKVVKPIIEHWVGRKVEPTSLYGIRVYKNNSILATHVDRLPLVSSAIIQLAQELDEPWPIEVYDHEGRAFNITMQPGDMVLYESHTVLHGRPFPMKGSYYANVFVHYQPLDHDEMNEQDQAARNEGKTETVTIFSSLFGSKSKDTKSINKDHGGHEQTNLDEARVDEMRRRFDRIDKQVEAAVREEAEGGVGDGSDRLEDNEKDNPVEVDNAEAEPQAEEEEEKVKADNKKTVPEQDPLLETEQDKAIINYVRLAEAIMKEDEISVISILEHHPALVHFADPNRWTALHEAIRTGNALLVKYLLDRGADAASKVRGGGDALAVAITMLPSEHPVITLLQEHIKKLEIMRK